MIDLKTGKEMSRRDFGKGIAAILAAGCAPTSVMGGMMRMTGARNAAVFGGVKSVLDHIDGKSYSTAGDLINKEGFTAITSYVQISGGHRISWFHGGASGADTSVCLIEYSNDRSFVDYWTRNGSVDGVRTFNLSSRTAFIRFPCVTQVFQSVYIYDNTDGKFIVKDAKIV